MKSIITITAFLLFALGSFAQQQFAGAKDYYRFEAREAARIGDAINKFHWDTLQGKIPVLYSKNYEVRAKAIQAMVEECAAFYQPKFPDIKFDLYIMVLNQKDWNKIHLTTLSNYGMPNYLPEIRKLFAAADKKAVAKIFGGTDNTSDTHLSQFDCIALHELGHAFLQTFNKLYTGKLWTDEFLASYFAICFFEQHKEYPGLPQVGETGYTPKYRTLADLERLYSNVGDQNYGWYQAQFQNLGYELYPKFKTRLINEFIKNASPEGKKLDPLALLQQIAPEITNQWLKEMK
ncbi:MAG: hypothetical protein J0H55_13045 [Chitinophagaceae bacterium]|nr:hypothetical protein [Chitinophagaceae bacterium]